MTPPALTRRALIGGAATLCAAPLAPRAQAAPKRRIRLGGACFLKSGDPEELAQWHVDRGYRAAYCPRNASLEDTAALHAIESAFAKHDVVLSEVGRWCNLMDAGPAARKANLERVTEGLALADAVGARCCVDIAGSHSTKHWAGPHPGNVTPAFFDAAVENARKIIDAVQPKRAKFCYEMMQWALPDSPGSYLRMLKAVDRPAFAVHLDPCNLINSPRRFFHNARVIRECFEELGPWIVSCHAKDLAWITGNSVQIAEVLPGTGEIDYGAYLNCLASLDHDAPLMIEHLKGEEAYDTARAYIMGRGAEEGIEF